MRLDLATRTLFAEFQESVFARTSLSREIKSTQTYVRKRVKGRVYWYLQRYEDGQYKQQYYGPSNTKTDSYVEAQRKELRSKKQELKQFISRESRFIAMLRRGGLPSLDKRLASVISILSDSGLVNEAGILIGTFAYTAYAGMLGALLSKKTLKTNDIDIIRDLSVKVAVTPSIDIERSLAKSGFSFRPVPSLNPKALPSSLVSPDGIRIDLLAIQKGKPKGVIPVAGLKGIGALEMPLMDFLVESSIRTVLLAPGGGIPVRVPDPAHFTIHKLIAAARRPVSESAKSAKDLEQASQLIHVLADERPQDLKSALRKAARRGKKWKKYLEDSIQLLPAESKELLKR